MKYVVYGKTNCPSCTSAKQLLESKGLSYEYLMLGKDYQMSDFIEAAQGNTHKTFPLIVHTEDGVESYVGGLQQLQQILGGK